MRVLITNIADALRKNLPVDTLIEQHLVDFNIKMSSVEWKLQHYKRLRKWSYPAIELYLDGVVKGDSKQIDDYISACREVKKRFPKGGTP